MVGLQKANFGKRIIAAIFDGILLSIIAVALAAALSSALGYDGYMNTVQEARARYEEQYSIDFDISAEKYSKLDDEQKKTYDDALAALNADENAVYAQNMLINLTLIIASVSMLFALLVIEFVVPLFFKNGQTLGKKIFGIGVMHTDGIEVTSVQMFARALLGKFVFGQIALSMILMIFFGAMGVSGTVILLAIVAAQIICLAVTQNGSLLHDVIAKTVTVDMASQRIFKDREALLTYTKKIAAEKAEKADY